MGSDEVLDDTADEFSLDDTADEVFLLEVFFDDTADDAFLLDVFLDEVADEVFLLDVFLDEVAEDISSLDWFSEFSDEGWSEGKASDKAELLILLVLLLERAELISAPFCEQAPSITRLISIAVSFTAIFIISSLIFQNRVPKACREYRRHRLRWGCCW